ncbi:MAG: ATP-binding protein [Nitrospinae bacterium]|nr:ATP-binding protein [Nitrospinota bacterium]
MASLETKGKSPFYPDQPVPADLFVGRAEQIQRIMERGVGQVKLGKPVAMFVEGEYGIGKSSIADFVQRWSAQDHGLHGIYVSLGGCKSMDDVAYAVLKATTLSGALNPTRAEAIKNWFAKYIGKQSLFGITLNLETIKSDAPGLAGHMGMLNFLNEVNRKLNESANTKGVFLVLDEINGIADNPQFAHFIKGFWDTNAINRPSLPLLLMLCGVEERRRELIRNHEPVARIFDVVEITPMTEDEMRNFFVKAFQSVQISIEESAMEFLIRFSAGFPKIMHLIGNAAFWIDKDGVISEIDAADAVLAAADEVGKKYVDQQVYKAIRSGDYHSILAKIARLDPHSMSFIKSEVSDLTESEKRKFNNFLQRMQKLNVIGKGEIKGEYVFKLRIVRLYLQLQSYRKTTK